MTATSGFCKTCPCFYYWAWTVKGNDVCNDISLECQKVLKNLWVYGDGGATGVEIFTAIPLITKKY